MNRTKLDVRDKNILTFLESGAYTLQKVADLFGVTRQRVQQIWKRERGGSYIPTRSAWKAEHPTLCAICSTQVDCQRLCVKHYQWVRYTTKASVRERSKESTRRWQAANREHKLAIDRKYYAKHREKLLKYARAYAQRRKRQQSSS